MLVAFLGLHLDRALQQVATLQVVHDESQQVDVADAEARPLLWDMLDEEPDMLAYPKLVLGREVEHGEHDLVAEPAAAGELGRGDPREDRGQAFGQSVSHRVTCRQGST